MNICETPSREVWRINNFSGMDNIPHHIPLHTEGMNKVYRNLDEPISGWLSQEFDCSRVAFMIHEAKDGVIAAERLAFDLDKVYNIKKWGVDTRNRPIDPCRLDQFIKNSSLIRAAKANNMWKRPRVITELVVMVISSIMIPLISIAMDNYTLPPILVIVFLLLIAGNYGRKYKKSRQSALLELSSCVKKFSLSQYTEFISQFTSNDFLFSKYSFTAHRDLIIVRNINDSIRSLVLLQQYISDIQNDQTWIIFLERRNSYNKFVLEKQDSCEKRVYYIKPFTKTEKKELAQNVGAIPNDPAIKRYGVDYILRSCVKIDYALSTDAQEDLTTRIEKFIKSKNEEGFRSSVATLIQFVAQLKTEFIPGPLEWRLWEQLFDYPQKLSPLDVLDHDLSLALFFTADSRNNGSLNDVIKLVSQIFKNFEDDFEDILDNRFIQNNSFEIEAYYQLLLVKALRYAGETDIDRCMAISELLRHSLQDTKQSLAAKWRSHYINPTWDTIFISVLDFLERSEVRWFSSWLIHTCLDIYSQYSITKRKRPLFSSTSVLSAARSNILLGADNSELNCDVIFDHFKVVRNAALEMGKASALQSRTIYPDSFSLLNLEDHQRREYYSALSLLNEQAVIKFYSYLFDLYCSIVTYSYPNSNISLWSREIAYNDLYKKYYNNGSSSLENKGEYYLSTIITQLLHFVGTFYERESILAVMIDELNKQMQNIDIIRRKQSLLWLLSQAEVSGYSTFVFSLCIMCQLESDDVYREMFMGIGNDLIRMLFLLIHERTGFVNDDFKYLIDIMTSYTQPNNVTLSFLSGCGNNVMPKAVRKQIEEYMHIHRSTYFQNILVMIETLKIENVETLLQIIFISNHLTPEEKEGIYKNIRERLNRQFASSPRRQVCNELISVLLDHKIEPSLSQMDTEEIVTGLQLNHTPDSAYILYNEYISIDCSRFIPYCPKIATHLMMSSFSGCWVPLFIYLNEVAHDQAPEDYSFVAHRLYNYCFFHAPNIPFIETVNIFIDFLRNLFGNLAHYSWVTEESLYSLIYQLQCRRDELSMIEAQAIFRQRKWSRYGILLYVRFLMQNDPTRPLRMPKEYTLLSPEEEIAYCAESFHLIEPFVTNEAGHEVFNQIYFDLLGYIIENKGIIQEQITEYNSLRKIAEDALVIVERCFTDHNHKQQVILLIREYIEKLAIYH